MNKPHVNLALARAEREDGEGGHKNNEAHQKLIFTSHCYAPSLIYKYIYIDLQFAWHCSTPHAGAG